MGPEDRNHFNDLLDGALKHYGEVEPRAGLEGRVLARLAAEPSGARSRAVWAWALAGAIVALLVIGIWFGPRSVNKVHQEISVRALREVINPHAPAQPIVPQVSKSKGPRLHRAHQLRVAKVGPEPRLAQFPSPRPISEQERMLVGYVERYPEEAKLIANQQYEFEQKVKKAVEQTGSRLGSDQDER